MSTPEFDGSPVAEPPWRALQGQLERWGASLAPERGAELAAMLASWQQAQARWETDVLHRLSLHHDINNALVGVRGNAQLLLLGAAGRDAGVRERLEVMLREAGRIQEAAGRLQALKRALEGDGAPIRRVA